MIRAKHRESTYCTYTKSKKDIREGDILGYGDNYPCVVMYNIFEGKFEAIEFGYQDEGYLLRTHELVSYTSPWKIMGNIDDNPDMMTGYLPDFNYSVYIRKQLIEGGGIDEYGPFPIFEEAESTTIGVGEGSGNMYVHGDHDSIKHLQGKLLELEKLRKFKEYTHKRLDDAGIEKEPNGEHSKAGCRIGDRLDIVLGKNWERELVQPSKIEAYLAQKYQHRKDTDPEDGGFTGHYALSPKELLDIYMDLIM
jgi:hypothetical protein